MSAAALLDRLNGVGITLTLDGGDVRVRGPRRALDDATRAEIAANKPAIVSALSPSPSSRWAGLLRPGVCADCGGPAPRDGRHWCGDCERRAGGEHGPV